MKDIPGYEGLYQIDEHGKVISLRREKIVNNRLYAWAAQDRSCFIDTNGYRYVGLSKDGKAKKIAVHTLVLLTYFGPKKPGQIALHKDGNKLNNHISNLRWGSFKENYQDSVDHKTAAIGERNGLAKLKIKDVIEILKSDVPSTRLCKKYKVASSTIRAIRIKQNWSRALGDIDVRTKT